MSFIYDQSKLNQIAKKSDLKFVILHGSYARGTMHEGSDLDIAVVGNHKLSFEKISHLYGNLDEVFGDSPERELDFKDVYGADPFFLYEVTRDGRLLYGDAADYEAFKAGTRRAYEDAAPLFALEAALVKKFQLHLNRVAAQYA